MGAFRRTFEGFGLGVLCLPLPKFCESYGRSIPVSGFEIHGSHSPKNTREQRFLPIGWYPLSLDRVGWYGESLGFGGIWSGIDGVYWLSIHHQSQIHTQSHHLPSSIIIHHIGERDGDWVSYPHPHITLNHTHLITHPLPYLITISTHWVISSHHPSSTHHHHYYYERVLDHEWWWLSLGLGLLIIIEWMISAPSHSSSSHSLQGVTS